MGLATLRPNQLIRWRDHLLKLTGRLPDGNWHLVDVTSGLIDKQPDSELWRAFERKELVFVCEEDDRPCRSTNCIEDKREKALVAALSQNAEVTPTAADNSAARENAETRFRYVKATFGLNFIQIAKVVRSLWSEFKWPDRPPHPNSILNWRRKAQLASDPISALVEHHDKKGWRDRYDPEYLDKLRTVRDEKYMCKNPRRSIARVAEIAADEIRVQNDQRPPSDRLPIPGLRTMKSIIMEISAEERYAARYGSDAALNLYRYSLGGVHAENPLDRCELDHTPLSVVLLDEDMFPWGRANASLGLDAAVKTPTGAYWGAEVPSIVSIARAIRSSLQPKLDLLARYPNVRGSWPCWGVAKKYVVDNGLEEHAKALRQACSEIGGSTLELCGRKRAWFKPNVERFFRTLDLDLLQSLPGATMENFLKRCDFNPKKDMLLRKSTFDRIFMKWLVDVYMREPLASLNKKAPIDAWQKKILGVDQLVPSKTVLLERLFFRKVEGRRLDQEGIEFDCQKYNSTDLGALRTQLGSVLYVDIWVSDENIGHIHVCVPKSDLWIRVPSLELEYADGMTRWQHDKCKRMQRVGTDEGRELSLAQARQEIEREIENETKEFRQAHRKRRARFKEKDPAHTEHNGAASNVSTPQVPAPEGDKSDDDTSDLLWDEDTPVPELDSYTTK